MSSSASSALTIGKKREGEPIKEPTFPKKQKSDETTAETITTTTTLQNYTKDTTTTTTTNTNTNTAPSYNIQQNNNNNENNTFTNAILANTAVHHQNDHSKVEEEEQANVGSYYSNATTTTTTTIQQQSYNVSKNNGGSDVPKVAPPVNNNNKATTTTSWNENSSHHHHQHMQRNHYISHNYTTTSSSSSLPRSSSSSSLPSIPKIPPYVVIIRTIRPYIQTLSILFWLYYRFILSRSNEEQEEYGASSYIQSGNNNNNNNNNTCSTTTFKTTTTTGLLDLFTNTYSTLTTYTYTSLSHHHHYHPPLLRRFLTTLLLLLNDILALILLHSTLYHLYTILHTTTNEVQNKVIQKIYEFAAAYIPQVQKELKKEEVKLKNDLQKELKKDTAAVSSSSSRVVMRKLPVEGRDATLILEDMQTKSKIENQKWSTGRVSGGVYSGDPTHTNLLNQVYATYSLSNPLHIDIWPSINQYEAEVISMTAHLLNGGNGNDDDDEGIVGSTSSGGTESIVLAVKAHRNYYCKKLGISRPEIVASENAHAGLDKACEILNIKLVRVTPDSITYCMKPMDVQRSITCNTIMIYASAPSFPQGVIDPVEELSTLAKRFGVGLHVDACLGGFVLPFAKMLGYEIRKFDFECEGVTSMSVDTHKYGYASKGTSVVLYRHNALRREQYFSYCKWPGGLYATPTIAGSRPGALIACAWASLMTLGESGFKSRVKSIMETTQTIANAISSSSVPGLYLLGGMPHAMIVCFGSKEFDIYRVGDKMTKRGWSLNSLQRPACIHLCVTLKTVAFASEFIQELREAVEEVREEGDDGKKGGSAALYGMAGSLPAGPVDDLSKCYLDVVLST